MATSSTSPARFHDLDDDTLTEILRRLDGPSLAAASCVSNKLKTLAADPDIWKGLCISKWPSLQQLLPILPTSIRYRSFFSDNHPFPSPDDLLRPSASAPDEIISIVDLYDNATATTIFSNVVATETKSAWFASSPFLIDAMENLKTGSKYEEEVIAYPDELGLSWIVIDPRTGRGVNLSSRTAVTVTKRLYTADVEVRFAIAIGDAAATVVVVVVSGRRVREVSLRVEGMDGEWLGGRESLGLVMGAAEGKRGGAKTAEEAKGRYLEYERRRRERIVKKSRSQGWVDFCFMVLGVTLFLGSIGLMVAR